MPAFAQWAIGAAAFVVAATTLWTKAVRPGARIVSSIDRGAKVMAEFVDEFHAAPELIASLADIAKQFTPELITTLADIAKQFKPNRGTSLRDVVDRLEGTQATNTGAIRELTAKLDVLHEALRKRGTA